MELAENIKRLRKEKSLLQKEVANAVGVHPSNYSKMEKGERDISIEIADKLAVFFGLTLDELVRMPTDIPKEITLENKTIAEKVRLIQQLEEDDQKAVFRIIDGMLTKTKFKDFFQKNIAIT